MLRTTPDEQGWYWVNDPVSGEWQMACVNTFHDTVTFLDGDNAARINKCDLEDIDGLVWYGPFACPGGDFGAMTIEKDVELYEKATAEGKAIVIEHVDFRCCNDGQPTAQVTLTSLIGREEAKSLIYRRSGER